MNFSQRFAVLGAVLSISAATLPAHATTGKVDPFLDGAKVGKPDVFTDGGLRERDLFTDGARTSRFDSFMDGARVTTPDPYADPQ